MQNERALKPKGRDKWALIGRAVGTTNALQPFAVESRPDLRHSPRASRGRCYSRAGRRPTLLSISASFSSFDSGACHRSTDDLASCCLVFRGWRDRWALPPPGSSLPTAAVRCGKGGTKQFVVAELTIRVYKRALQKRALCENDRHDRRVPKRESRITSRQNRDATPSHILYAPGRIRPRHQ